MSDRIEIEEVAGVVPPPKARVEDAMPETVQRKVDYLAGFLDQKPAEVAIGEPGGAVYEAVIEALKEIYDPEIPVNIYDLGLIYGVDVADGGHVAVTMTLTTPHCPVAETMPGEVELRVGAVPGSWDGGGEPYLGPAMGPREDVRRGEARIGDAVMATTTRVRPAALDLTPAAEQRIADLMRQAPEGTVGVKLSTPRRGCSGLAYSVDYVAAADPMDEQIATSGGDLFVDAGSVLYLIGSRMDWVEDDFAAGFVFQNPNAKGACGCGESFTV